MQLEVTKIQGGIDDGDEGNEGGEGNEGDEGDEGDKGDEGNEGDEGNGGEEKAPSAQGSSFISNESGKTESRATCTCGATLKHCRVM